MKTWTSCHLHRHHRCKSQSLFCQYEFLMVNWCKTPWNVFSFDVFISIQNIVRPIWWGYESVRIMDSTANIMWKLKSTIQFDIWWGKQFDTFFLTNIQIVISSEFLSLTKYGWTHHFTFFFDVGIWWKKIQYKKKDSISILCPHSKDRA